MRLHPSTKVRQIDVPQHTVLGKVSLDGWAELDPASWSALRLDPSPLEAPRKLLVCMQSPEVVRLKLALSLGEMRNISCCTNRAPRVCWSMTVLFIIVVWVSTHFWGKSLKLFSARQCQAVWNVWHWLSKWGSRFFDRKQWSGSADSNWSKMKHQSWRQWQNPYMCECVQVTR